MFLLAAGAMAGQTLKTEALTNPSGPDSSQVNWSVTQDGSAIMSWVESDTLKYAIRRGSQWSEPRTVAAKRHFFHHPAELPEVIAMPKGAYMAHWIEAPNPDSEAEFIFVSASKDGVKWTTPAPGQRDKSDVEHGLASMVSNGDGAASIFFLQSLKGPDAPTSLMRSVIGADGRELREEMLAADVCECCPTSAARTARGLIVAFRGRTQDNIRDIAVTRFENGRWTSPKIVFPDKWQLDACPVNAASVSAKGDKVAISWYTASGDKPRVELAMSPDSGADFSKAVVISTGNAYGYTSIAIDDAGGAYVSWLERGGDNAKLLARHVSADGTAGPVTEVATGARKTLGYPRLIRAGKETLIAWNTESKVMTAKLGM
ncbi:MAG: hypothetical protein M3N93_15095 [Acidobacteriota bacterium]|nr:hypothetical protein [Acidobacteriota bacterium]